MIHGLSLLRRGALVGALACLTAVGVAIPTTAAAKVTSLTSCQTISSPGRYRLDMDVSGVVATDCFDISASGVTLNLNGHTIGGEGFNGIAVGGSGVKILGPGTISNFGIGIILEAGGDGSVRGVTATGNGEGIALQSAGNSVQGNVTTDNIGTGIETADGGTGNTITGNYAHGNGGFDLRDVNSNCDSNMWRGNDFTTANQSCIQ
jgi:parallel beta-helix repeat protein